MKIYINPNLSCWPILDLTACTLSLFPPSLLEREGLLLVEEVLRRHLLLEDLLEAALDGLLLGVLADPGREHEEALLRHVPVPVIELAVLLGRLEQRVAEGPAEEVAQSDEAVFALEGKEGKKEGPQKGVRLAKFAGMKINILFRRYKIT